jgi:hypothetical protein
MVLENMKVPIDRKNATGKFYGYLVYRVNIHTRKEQVYGTQFEYNQFGEALPKKHI